MFRSKSLLTPKAVEMLDICTALSRMTRKVAHTFSSDTGYRTYTHRADELQHQPQRVKNGDIWNRAETAQEKVKGFTSGMIDPRFGSLAELGQT